MRGRLPLGQRPRPTRNHLPAYTQGSGGWQEAASTPSHLSRKKRTKATRRATREMQWPR